MVALACLLAIVPGVLGRVAPPSGRPHHGRRLALSGGRRPSSRPPSTISRRRPATSSGSGTPTRSAARIPATSRPRRPGRAGSGRPTCCSSSPSSDHAYGYWKGDNVAISDAGLEQVLSQEMEPALRVKRLSGRDRRPRRRGWRTRWPPAGPTVLPEETPIPDITFSTTIPGGDASGGSTAVRRPARLLTLAIAAALVIAFGWWFLYVRPRRARRAAAARSGTPADPNADLVAMQPKDLDELANRILVETDDAIRDSDQELGFAQAQFGDDAAAPFVAAIAAARDDLKGAFTLRQRLDDATPRTLRPGGRCSSTWSSRAARRRPGCTTRPTASTSSGRSRRRRPDILARLPAKADALEARLPAAEATLAGLAEYADADWQAVAANVDNARTRIAAVRAAADEGTKALAAGTRGRRGARRPAWRGWAGPGSRVPGRDRPPDSGSGEGARGGRRGARRGRGRSGQGQGGRGRRSAGPRRGPPAGRGRATAGRRADGPGSAQAGRDRRLRQGPPRGRARRCDRGGHPHRARAAGTRGRPAPGGAVGRPDGGDPRADYVGGQRGGIGHRGPDADRGGDQTPGPGHRARRDGPGRRTRRGQHGDEPRGAGRAARPARLRPVERPVPRWAPAGWGRGGGAGADIGGAIIGGIIGGLLSGGGHRGGPFGGFGGGDGGGGGFGGFGGGGGGFGGFGGSSGGGSFGGGGGSSGGGRW